MNVSNNHSFWTPESEQVERTRGFESPAEMQAQMDAKVAIAGVGGAGYPLGLNLARKGVQRFVVTDPDTIELANFNRLPGANVGNIGINKAVTFAKDIKAINPSAEVTILDGGLNPDNAEDLIDGCDVVFDGIDFNLPQIAVALHRAARYRGIPSVTGLEVGPSAMVTSFNPRTITFEEMMGFDKDESLDSITKKSKDGANVATSVPYIPYKSTHMDTFLSVQNGAPLPTTVEGVALFSALATRQIFLHLVKGVSNNRPDPAWAKEFVVHDLDRNFAGTVSISRARFLFYVAQLALRSKMNLNPRTGY